MSQVGILRIKNLVDSLLDFVKSDYEDKVALQSTVVLPSDVDHISESFLMRCFDSDDNADEISYKELATEIFTRGESDSRKIGTRIMFDADRANLPTIHVREPAKGKGKTDSIGYRTEDFYENFDGGYTDERRRSFSSQFELMITSPNRHEVIIIEEVLIGLLIGAQDTLALSSPFYTFDFSVKELIANNELVPFPLFIKAIGINVSYDKTYPDLTNNELLNKILFLKKLLQ